MRGPSRRDLLRAGLGASVAGLLGAALPSLGCRRKVSPEEVVARRPSAKGPRYYIQILLSGGHDTLYTTDPKTPAQVDPHVALPAQNKVVTHGDLRLGPQFAKLERFAGRLAVVNGVQTRTVNHDTGFNQYFRLATNVNAATPTVLDILGARRDDIPLGATYLNLSNRTMHSPRFIGTADPFYLGKDDLFGQIAAAEPEELDALARLLRRDAGAFVGDAPEAATTAAYARDVAAFFERAAKVSPLEPFQRSSDYVAQAMSDAMARALWLIENDLTRGVIVDVGLLGWDTHQRNEIKQTEMNGNFVACFADLLSDLATRSNAHGVLAEQTLVVVGSELGRFPQLNDMLGKDHLPQTSFIFAGPGVRAGRTFGATSERLEGLPISYATGEPDPAGRIPVLDDIGATLLHHAGLDPERYGYSGEPLGFLFEDRA
jgi:uncharacterized protein (DUF1501 family)